MRKGRFSSCELTFLPSLAITMSRYETVNSLGGSFLLLPLILAGVTAFGASPSSAVNHPSFKTKCIAKFKEISGRSYFTEEETIALARELRNAFTVDRFARAEAKGDPHIQFLKELGVTRQDLTLFADPQAMIDKLYAKTNGLVKTGQLRPNETILPMRAYRNKETGELVFRKFGERAPDGFEKTDFLTIDEFWQMVDVGGMPLSSPKEHLSFGPTNMKVSLGSGFMHDLAHFSGLHQDPQLMKALREEARYIHTLSGKEKELAINRAFIPSETLALVPTDSDGKAAALIRMAGLHDRSGELLKEWFLKTQLHKKSMEELATIAIRILRDRPKLLYLGGSVRDPMSRTETVMGKTRDQHMFRELDVASYLEETLNNAFSQSNPERLKESLINEIVDTLQYLHTMRDQTPAQVTKDIIRGNKESPYYRFFCDPRRSARYPMIEERLCRPESITASPAK